MDITELSEKDLFAFLKYNDDNYHNGQPIISDNEYDSIRDFAFSKYPDNEYFLFVGAPVQNNTKNKKVSLKYTLGSLKKIKAEQIEELNRWLAKYSGKEIVITAKLDGISAFIEKKDKNFFACTRGDGKEGFDITAKVSKFVDVDNTYDYEVRGEIVWCCNAYKDFNFANRRNAVAGIINSDEGKNAEKLTFMAHELINSGITKESYRLLALKRMGFTIPLMQIVDTSKENITSELLQEILQKFKAHYTDIIDIDGLVLCVNDSERENVYYPEKKVAFKLNDEFRQGVVDKIVWTVNRTGKLVPVVYLKEKLLLSGAYVEKATAHNYKFVKESGLGEGAVVNVTRSGEVIPYIVGIIKKADVTSTVAECPCCGNTHIRYNKTMTDLICDNPNCSDQVISKIEYFIKAMGVEYISAQTLKNLKINSIESFYEIDEDYILGFEGFAVKSAKKIVSSIKNSLIDVKPAKFIKALGIEGLGEKNAEKLLASLKDDIYPVEGFFNMSYQDIIKVDGFGEILAENIFKEKRNYYNTLYKFFKNKGITFKKKDKLFISKNTLNGKNIMMTGAYSIPRYDLENMIMGLGGNIQSSVNKKTDILICEDVNGNSTKLQKARELVKKGSTIEIIAYDEFMQSYQ